MKNSSKTIRKKEYADIDKDIYKTRIFLKDNSQVKPVSEPFNTDTMQMFDR